MTGGCLGVKAGLGWPVCVLLGIYSAAEPYINSEKHSLSPQAQSFGFNTPRPSLLSSALGCTHRVKKLLNVCFTP